MRGGWRMGAASRRSIGLLRLPGFLCSYVLMTDMTAGPACARS